MVERLYTILSFITDKKTGLEGNVLKLTKEQKDMLIDKLQSYYFNLYDKELGLIGAENWLSFFMKECAPVIYNQALKDAKFVVEQQFASIQEELDVLEQREDGGR